jgi:ribosomal protein S18 acetylase RimI-like enzyme
MEMSKSSPRRHGTSSATKTAKPAVAAVSRAKVEPLIRAVNPADLATVVKIDEKNSGVGKPDYWLDQYERYLRRPKERFFLVGEFEDRIVAFAIGEIRAWEFGSPPCGGVFSLGVDPSARLRNIGSQLIDAMSESFRLAGVAKLRTMLRRDDNLNLSFFRSLGMMAGPFIQLEKDLDE